MKTRTYLRGLLGAVLLLMALPAFSAASASGKKRWAKTPHKGCTAPETLGTVTMACEPNARSIM